ncbi:unnamed protein product, partial [Hapterophycus canaliculatus]
RVIAARQGHANSSMPVRASVSEDGLLAVSGSGDGSVHVWDCRPDVSWSGEGETGVA